MMERFIEEGHIFGNADCPECRKSRDAFPKQCRKCYSGLVHFSFDCPAFTTHTEEYYICDKCGSLDEPDYIFCPLCGNKTSVFGPSVIDNHRIPGTKEPCGASSCSLTIVRENGKLLSF